MTLYSVARQFLINEMQNHPEFNPLEIEEILDKHLQLGTAVNIIELTIENVFRRFVE